MTILEEGRKEDFHIGEVYPEMKRQMDILVTGR